MDTKYKVFIINSRTRNVLAVFEDVKTADISGTPNTVTIRTNNGRKHVVSLNSETACFLIDEYDPYMRLYF